MKRDDLVPPPQPPPPTYTSDYTISLCLVSELNNEAGGNKAKLLLEWLVAPHCGRLADGLIMEVTL